MSDAAWVALTLHMSNSLDTSDADSIASFIGCGDLINHAIITHGELTRGLIALAERGWLEVNRSTVRLAKQGRAAVDEAIAEAGSPMAFAPVETRIDGAILQTGSAAPVVSVDAFAVAHGQYTMLMDSLVIKVKTKR
jgi:hypothetical protein